MAFQYPGFQLNAFQITRRGNLAGQLPSPFGSFTQDAEDAVTGDLAGSIAGPTGAISGAVAVAGDLGGQVPSPFGNFAQTQQPQQQPSNAGIGGPGLPFLKWPKGQIPEHLLPPEPKVEVLAKREPVVGIMRGAISPPSAHFEGTYNHFSDEQLEEMLLLLMELDAAA
jgi:hypothetical protein